MGDRELTVVSGAVIACRLFDVADTIDLGKAEDLWRERLRTSVVRSRLVFTPPKAVAFGVPPLEIPLESSPICLEDGEVRANATARLYDFGVTRLAIRVAVDNMLWTDFTKRVIAVDRSIGPSANAAIWNQLLGSVREIFTEAFVRPSKADIEEDYLIGMVRAFDEALTADELQQRINLVPLLSGEERTLSEGARRDLLRQRFSYYTDDLVVLTWDRAFIYEPRGDSDVIDVLDVANAQLLEMRYYDQVLDAELPRMYALVETTQRTRPFLTAGRFANLARRLYALVAEVTELRERVDNALQVTEDVYLARIYVSALELFRITAVNSAVERKLAIIRDTYAALYEEASAGRGALMEATIIVLIALEIVLAVWRP